MLSRMMIPRMRLYSRYLSTVNVKPNVDAILPETKSEKKIEKVESTGLFSRYLQELVDIITGTRRKSYDKVPVKNSLPEGTPEATTTAMAAFEPTLTPWQKKWKSLKANFEASATYRHIDRAVKVTKRNIETSENPIIKGVVDTKKKITEKIEDIKEQYETSQDPTVCL